MCTSTSVLSILFLSVNKQLKCIQCVCVIFISCFTSSFIFSINNNDNDNDINIMFGFCGEELEFSVDNRIPASEYA